MSESKLLAGAMDTVTSGLFTTGTQAGFTGNNGVIELLPAIINVLLGVLGIVALILIIYSGILYLISQGNKDIVEKAKKVLMYSALGMIIIVASYAIANYLIGALLFVVTT